MPPRRTQQERRDRARRAILDAAAALIVESGVRALTLARVGERAGYSRGIVTHHFGSKQALVDALARSIQTGFVPGLDDTPGFARLLALIEGYVAALDDVGIANRAFLLLWVEAATAPELAEVFRDRDAGFRSEIRADVVAGIAGGTIRPDSDPDSVAVSVLAELRGIGLQRLLDPAAVPTEQLRGAVTERWRRALEMRDPRAAH